MMKRCGIFLAVCGRRGSARARHVVRRDVEKAQGPAHADRGACQAAALARLRLSAGLSPARSPKARALRSWALPIPRREPRYINLYTGQVQYGWGRPGYYRGQWNGGSFGPCWTYTPIGMMPNCN